MPTRNRNEHYVVRNYEDIFRIRPQLAEALCKLYHLEELGKLTEQPFQIIADAAIQAAKDAEYMAAQTTQFK